MNLYAIQPAYAPYDDVSFVLVESAAEAMQHGVFVAASDAARGHGSPEAAVYLVARGVEHVGDAVATDAPRSWQWAHPAVEEGAAREACEEAVYATDDLWGELP